MPLPFLDPDTLPWTHSFIERFETLAAEAAKHVSYMTPLYERQVETADGGAVLAARWYARTLVFFTIRNTGILKHMPAMTELLDGVPNLTSAVLLRLDGDTHIRPHIGYTPDVVRCHLGLEVPEVEECVLRVGNELRNWREREWLVFDDYLEHEVWHRGRQPRVVLLIDVVRPGVELSPHDVAIRFFTGYPGTNFDDELRSLASPELWLEWLAAGAFPTRSSA